jgi:hypothetical protein
MDMKVGGLWRIFPACTPESNLLDHLASKALSGTKLCERFEVRLWYIHQELVFVPARETLRDVQTSS